MQEGFGCCMNSFFTFINNHTGASTFHMPHMTLQGIINRYASASTRLTIISSQACSLFKGTSRDVTTACFDNYMRSWYATRMQPDVISGSLVKSHLFILATILAN